MAGRPTLYTPELLDLICGELSKGIPLTRICARDDVPVAPRTVMDWEARDDDISASIARAREAGEIALAEECLTIADDGTNDFMEKVGRDGAHLQVPNTEHIQRSKLRIDTRMKLLAKFNPKKWGERLALEHDVVNNAQDLQERLERARQQRLKADQEPDPEA